MRFVGVPWYQGVDFLFLAVTLYFALRWLERTRAIRLAVTALLTYIGALLARRLDLLVTAWILTAVAILLGLSIVVVFQSEFRSALTRLESLFSAPREVRGKERNEVLADAVFDLASRGLGALIVIPQRTAIEEVTHDGTPFGAMLSPATLHAIFQKQSPLHDGAAILLGSTITKVNVVLPLTRRPLPIEFGTRHRAALGLSEVSDATIIVASEETGEVRIACRGQFREMRNRRDLAGSLAEYRGGVPQTGAKRAWNLVIGNWRPKVLAASLAAAIWGATFLAPGSAARTIVAGVEVDRVPDGMAIASQSASRVEVDLRGSPWLLGSVDPRSNVVRIALPAHPEPVQSIRLTPNTLDLPPGVVVERFRPSTIDVKLEKQR